MKRILLSCFALLAIIAINAQDIPEHISYTQIYDYIDELANSGVIEINSVAKPYSRNFIAQKLTEANAKRDELNRRQQKDLDFYMNNYALELDTVPSGILNWTNRETFALTLLQPAFHFKSDKFKMRITPILGMEVVGNKKGAVIERRWGASLEMDVVNHLSMWGSLRDISYNGKLLKGEGMNVYDAKLSMPDYLNQYPGCQYKEASYGGDYSDSRFGIRAYTSWGSIGVAKDNIVWGDNVNGSNIISGRAPSFPMITMHAKPCKWFEFNYFHAWLVSNVIDSTNYYVEETYTDTTSKIHYRPKNKYMAATMLTFTPVRKLDISIGNAIVYAENNINLGYFTPFAFYKSIDHAFTKGLGVENQNSMLYLNISSRNVKHLHLYFSMYVDEINTKRWKKSNPEHNPFSYKFGAQVSNWPVKNLSLDAEFTRTNVANYVHSISALSYTSNSYGLGSWLGDNSQDIYVALNYRPIRGLYFKLSYNNSTKYNQYKYVRRSISQIIAQKPFDEKTWRNDEVAFKAVYEPFNNCYVDFVLMYNNAKGYDLTDKEPFSGETRLDAQGNLNKFTPKLLQGKNVTAALGVHFNF